MDICIWFFYSFFFIIYCKRFISSFFINLLYVLRSIYCSIPCINSQWTNRVCL